MRVLEARRQRVVLYVAVLARKLAAVAQIAEVTAHLAAENGVLGDEDLV